MKKSSQIEEKYYNLLIENKVTSNRKRIERKFKKVFKNISFENKTFLDIGSGNGIYSLFAFVEGAKEIISLEPLLDGSTNKSLEKFYKLKKELKAENVIIYRKTLQDFLSDKNFDIILLHNSINHIDEESCKVLHKDLKAKATYLKIFRKLNSLLKDDGALIISDCTRYSFWSLLHLRNPFQPYITWDLHQTPTTWLQLLNEAGFKKQKCYWSSFNRMGKIGFIFENKIMSFFFNSHFTLYLMKKSRIVE